MLLQILFKFSSVNSRKPSIVKLTKDVTVQLHTFSETGPHKGRISKFEVDETIPFGKASPPKGLHFT